MLPLTVPPLGQGGIACGLSPEPGGGVVEPVVRINLLGIRGRCSTCKGAATAAATAEAVEAVAPTAAELGALAWRTGAFCPLPLLETVESGVLGKTASLGPLLLLAAMTSDVLGGVLGAAAAGDSLMLLAATASGTPAPRADAHFWPFSARRGELVSVSSSLVDATSRRELVAG